jgi:hypothetical protein
MGYYSTITDVELEAKLERAENPVLEEEWNTFLFNARNDSSNFLLNVLEAEAAFSDDGELEEILFGTAGREGKLYHIKDDLDMLKKFFDAHKIPFKFTIRVEGEDGGDVVKYYIDSDNDEIMASQAELMFPEFSPLKY